MACRMVVRPLCDYRGEYTGVILHLLLLLQRCARHECLLIACSRRIDLFRIVRLLREEIVVPWQRWVTR